MPGPIRTHRATNVFIEEKDVLPYIPAAATRINQYASLHSQDFVPLADFKTLPENLFAVTQSNGDVFLQYADGTEVDFDVVGMIVGLCLEVPSGFSKSSFPHFRRWVKVTGGDEPLFSSAIEASQVLYNFLALHATDVLPQPSFLSGASACFRPSATMLTSVETIPDVTAIEVPPLYDLKPLEAAMRSSHGRYIFSSDNEVLFFHDKEKTTDVVVRQEVGPRSVKIGQIVRIKTRFRLLKQENGNFTFRELLKGIYILDDGVCKELARKQAEGSVGGQQKTRRDVKFYTVPRGSSGGSAAVDTRSANAAGGHDDMAL